MSAGIQIRDATQLQMLVGKWLRVRAEHAAERRPLHILPQEFEGMTQQQLFLQLAADAEHSWLLRRLFDGEDPLPFEEWKEKYLK